MKLTKPHYWIILSVSFCLLVFLLIPHKNTQLTSLPDPNISNEFKLFTPSRLYFFEPLIGLSGYFLSFTDIKQQLGSWLIWIIFCCFIFNLIKKNEKKYLLMAFKSSGISLLWFIAFITLILILPVSKYRLLRNSLNYLTVDFHSHTAYSHDGIATPEDSYIWHKRHNFDMFFVTDHNTNQYRSFNQNQILPGEEISDLNNNHLLILGLTESISTLRGQPAGNITESAHKNNGAVIVAHWWQEQGSSLEELFKAGVDGFEIYGHEKNPLTIEIQNKIIAFCKANKLVAVSGTNWHGWGARNDTWTTFNAPKTSKEPMLIEIINALRNRKTEKFNVIFINQNYTVNNLRIIFEPFMGLFSYFIELNFYQILAWFLWIVLTCLLLCNRITKILTPYFYFPAGLILFILSITFYAEWSQFCSFNGILLSLTQIYFVLSGIFVFLGYKKKKLTI